MGYRPRRDISEAVVRIVMEDHDGLAQVRNITQQGVQIRAALPAEVGAPLVIHLRNRRFIGRIVWTNDSATGVVFATPLRPVEVALFTGRSDPAHRAARARVGFRGM